jgi:hypothetical protein
MGFSDVEYLWPPRFAWAPKSPDRVFVPDTGARLTCIPASLGRRAVTPSLRWRVQVMTRQLSQITGGVRYARVGQASIAYRVIGSEGP